MNEVALRRAVDAARRFLSAAEDALSAAEDAKAKFSDSGSSEGSPGPASWSNPPEGKVVRLALTDLSQTLTSTVMAAIILKDMVLEYVTNRG